MRAPRALALAIVACLLPAASPPADASPEERPTHLVQISLLLASKSGPSELADLPANARKAIEDVREFLPFKSYRLLDTGLVRTALGARTKLRGPGGGEFVAALNIQALDEPGKIMVRNFELIQQLRHEVPLPPPAAASEGGTRAAPEAPRPSMRPVMSSSFAAEIGQTVVVGTSRLNGGDEALIVLFTALP